MGDLDILTASERARDVIPEGFPGQRMLVMAPHAVSRTRRQPGTRHLHVTDVGYFPKARRHGRVRREPIEQAVVLLVTGGRGWCSTSQGTFDVSPGQVVIIPPGEPHAYGADADRPWTLWWLHLGGLDLGELLRSAGMTAAAPVRRAGSPVKAMGLVDEILQAMERDVTDAGRLAASGAAWHLMATLASDRPTSAGRSQVLDEAAAHVRAHLDEPLDIDALAASAHLSRSHFGALFKAQFGMTLLQYQTQLRMSRARELLVVTDHPVARIAQSLGYEPFYFTRVFSQTHEVPPREYRRRFAS